MINRVVRCQRSSVTPNLDFGVTELSPMSSTYCVRSLRAICLQQLSFLCSVFKPPLATAIESGLVHRCCPSVRLSVCLSVVKIQKNATNLELWSLLTTYRLFKEPIIGPLKSKMAEIRNQCHYRATLQVVRISSVKLKFVFHHILFFFVFCS